jgi:hypothetical protein
VGQIRDKSVRIEPIESGTARMKSRAERDEKQLEIEFRDHESLVEKHAEEERNQSGGPWARKKLVKLFVRNL